MLAWTASEAICLRSGIPHSGTRRPAGRVSPCQHGPYIDELCEFAI
ncbi:hypothetical protein [Ktedonobacter sp. SOSP1-52]|nr:hypothetical protein [Ktedonobacter sp. SOSP1-52]